MTREVLIFIFSDIWVDRGHSELADCFDFSRLLLAKV